MKIQFIWWWDKAEQIYPLWRDGLRAALEEIEKKHEIEWILGEKEPTDDADFILFWGDSNCPLFNTIDTYKARKGIILTTDPHNIDNLRKLDVVFCESQPIYESVRQHGIRAVKAFGTDTNFFKPSPKTIKNTEVFYPATFSPWKRQSSIAYLGDKLLCVGTLQPDGYKELDACANAGVQIKQGYFPAEEIRDYYHRAEHVMIPAIHGSERTCLEAMACDILPYVNPKNKRTHSYIDEFETSGIKSPREFVVKNYSHITYAESLLKGML
jgi:hypothetical protein